MKKYELLRRTKKLPHNSVKSRSKFYPPKGNNGSEFNPLAFVFLLCLPLTLSGCMGIYEGGFECPAGTGVGCKSISDVNEMVNLGEIPKVHLEQPITAKPEIWYAPSMRRMEATDPKTVDCPSVMREKNLRENKVEDAPQSI